MGGCAAPNCQNRTEKGFRVFRFPANKERRQQWLINCRRAKWTPTARSVLCEVHFEASQFEQHRLDNQRKLKPNAVPTIFDVPNPPKRLENTRKLPKKRTTEIDENISHVKKVIKAMHHDHIYASCRSVHNSGKHADNSQIEMAVHESGFSEVDCAATVEVTTSDLPTQSEAENMESALHSLTGKCNSLEKLKKRTTEIDENISHVKKVIKTMHHGHIYASCSSVHDSGEHADNSQIEMAVHESVFSEVDCAATVEVTTSDLPTQSEAKNMESALHSLTAKCNGLEKQMKKLKRKMKNAQIKREGMARNLKAFLNEDQVEALGRGTTKGTKWSKETIQMALQLMFACGPTGYETLRNKHFPIPAPRTLRKCIWAKKQQEKIKNLRYAHVCSEFGSKSMAMRKAVDNYL